MQGRLRCNLWLWKHQLPGRALQVVVMLTYAALMRAPVLDVRALARKLRSTIPI